MGEPGGAKYVGEIPEYCDRLWGMYGMEIKDAVQPVTGW